MKKPIITAEQCYNHYLEKVHYSEDDYDEKRDKPIHRASMSGRCHLLQKYHSEFEEIEQDGKKVRVKKYEPKPLDKSSMSVFRIGDVFHKEIQESFNWLINVKNKDKTNIELKMEEKIKVNLFGLSIEGHYDIRIIDHDAKIVQSGDLKTMNPRAMSFFKKAPYSKKGYIIQLGIYLIDAMEKYPDYDHVVILSAWDKDKGNFFEIVLDNSIVLKATEDYYRELAETMKLDIEEIKPVIHPFSPLENWECNYCQYNHICTSPKIKR